MTWLYALNVKNHNDALEIINGNAKFSIESKLYQSRQPLSRAVIHFCLQKHIKINENEIRIGSNKYGKPYLVHKKQIEFNISHSKNWIICGISHNPIGVDIEYLKRLSYHNIASKLFTPYERDFVLNANDTRGAFFKIWTLKESYLKCKGTGLREPFGKSTIKIGYDTITIETNRTKVLNFHFASYRLAKEYQVAVCVQNEIPTTRIETISLSDLEL